MINNTLAKRIIPCLDIKEGRTVKGIQFEELVDAGDPVTQAEVYAREGADELVFLDITATIENRPTLISLVEKIASKIQIPFTVGGGIKSSLDVYDLLRAGADKISINSSAVHNPALISDIAEKFGSQCVVVAIDAAPIDQEWMVYTSGGKIRTERRLYEWAREAAERGAGEILFTSMAHDGTKKGYALDALKRLQEHINLPIIASGGAGSKEDFADVFMKTGVSAALAASLFHFGALSITELKNYLREENIPIR